MTLGEWLEARVAPPPSTLADALRAELGTELDVSFTEAPAALLRAGQRVLNRVLQAEPQTPAIAPALLLADALVTYAFEAVAESSSGAEQLAQDAMARFGALVTS